MEIYIFSKNDFGCLGKYEVVSDWSATNDLLSPQPSNFVLDDASGIEKGMIAVAKVGSKDTPSGSEFVSVLYIGMVTKVAKDFDTGEWSLSCIGISEILARQVVASPFASAAYGEYVAALIRGSVISSSDAAANIPFLSVVNNSTCVGPSPAWASNKTMTILSLIQELMLISDLGMKITLNEDNSGLTVTLFDRPDDEVSIDLTEDRLSGVRFSEDQQTSVNKIRFLPSSDNYMHKGEVDYFLLSDGSVSTDSGSALRIVPVVDKIVFYSDAQFVDGEIASTAASQLTPTSYSHEIEFSLDSKVDGTYLSKSQRELSQAYCGERLKCWGYQGDRSVSVSTVISRLRYSSDGTLTVTCGFSRSSLTDRIKGIKSYGDDVQKAEASIQALGSSKVSVTAIATDDSEKTSDSHVYSCKETEARIAAGIDATKYTETSCADFTNCSGTCVVKVDSIHKTMCVKGSVTASASADASTDVKVTIPSSVKWKPTYTAAGHGDIPASSANCYMTVIDHAIQFADVLSGDVINFNFSFDVTEVA